MRKLSTQNSAEIRDAVEDGKKRIATPDRGRRDAACRRLICNRGEFLTWPRPRLPPGKPQTLDDVMIAMDVVDTLRHREDLVRRELNEEGRESRADRPAARDLPRPGHRGARPRAGRRRQGAEGEPLRLHAGPGGLEAHAADAVGQAGQLRQGRRGIALAVLVGGWSALSRPGHAPGRAGRGAGRIEITETLPKALRQAHADVVGSWQRRGRQAEG